MGAPDRAMNINNSIREYFGEGQNNPQTELKQHPAQSPARQLEKPDKLHDMLRLLMIFSGISLQCFASGNICSTPRNSTRKAKKTATRQKTNRNDMQCTAMLLNDRLEGV
jgi:hypothetical protein